MRAAVAISPDTPSSAVTDALGNSVDMILVMTVVPGMRLITLQLSCHSLNFYAQARVDRSSWPPACPR